MKLNIAYRHVVAVYTNQSEAERQPQEVASHLILQVTADRADDRQLGIKLTAAAAAHQSKKKKKPMRQARQTQPQRAAIG